MGHGRIASGTICPVTGRKHEKKEAMSAWGMVVLGNTENILVDVVMLVDNIITESILTNSNIIILLLSYYHVIIIAILDTSEKLGCDIFVIKGTETGAQLSMLTN